MKFIDIDLASINNSLDILNNPDKYLTDNDNNKKFLSKIVDKIFLDIYIFSIINEQNKKIEIPRNVNRMLRDVIKIRYKDRVITIDELNKYNILYENTYKGVLYDPYQTAYMEFIEFLSREKQTRANVHILAMFDDNDEYIGHIFFIYKEGQKELVAYSIYKGIQLKSEKNFARQLFNELEKIAIKNSISEIIVRGPFPHMEIILRNLGYVPSHETLGNYIKKIEQHDGGTKTKPRKTEEKVLVGNRHRIVYKIGNRKFVHVNKVLVSLTEVRKMFAK